MPNMSATQLPEMSAVPAQQPKVPSLVTLTMPTAVAVKERQAEPIFGTVIPNRVFVGGISYDTTEAELLVAFSAFGAVLDTKIIVNQDGYNKGYGFVTFATEEEAQRIQAVNHCIILHNRRLNIAPAFKRQQSMRTKYPPILETNGPAYFTSQANVVNSAPNYGRVTPVAGFTTPLYQQAPPAVQYQPIYQYYSVPMNTTAAWPQNYYQTVPQSNAQTSMPPQASWEFDAASSNNNNLNNINNNNFQSS